MTRGTSPLASLRRLPLIGRLARRYAVRHKGQTIRAILGLLVATTVLATGLGLGESIAVSLEEEALRRFGPIEVSMRSPQPFDQSLVAQLLTDPDVRAAGLTGAPTLTLTGAAIHERAGLAEAFATIRGVTREEATRLGPLPGGAPEPGPGEVVLSDTLASRLGAGVGDVVRLRVSPPNPASGVDFESITLLGVTGAQRPDAAAHALDVHENALGLGVELSWGPAEAGANVTVIATSPGGVPYANASATPPLRLTVPGPLETGRWTFRVESATPVTYQGVAGVAYLPPEAITESLVAFDATVVGVTPEAGRAGFTSRPTALVPLVDLQRELDLTGQATNAYFALPPGADPFAAAAALEDALGARSDAFEVRADKAELMERAVDASADITGFLLGMSAFTLIAAVLLAFTLFSALVEERRAELGIARALGLTQGEVALAMTLEGALYAAAAALVGLVVGVGVLAGLLGLIDSVAAAREGPRFALHLSPRTLVTSFLLGTLLPLATIGVSSLRFARLDPARAIRGIPDDPRQKRRSGLVAALVVAALGALASFDPVLRIVGIPLLVAAAATLLWSLGLPLLALVAAAGGVAHIAYTLYTFTAFPPEMDELDPVLTLARGGLLALGLSALAVASARPYDRLARLFRGGRAQRSGFLAFRYLVSRRRPAGLTMAMVALVVVIVTVMGTLFVVFGGSIPTSEAGYTVVGEGALLVDGFPRELPPDLEDAIAHADFLPSHVEFQQARVTRENGEIVPMRAGMRQFLGVDEGFAQTNEYEVGPRAPQYATSRDAWLAVGRGEAILPPEWALERNGLVPGEIIVVETTVGGPRTYVVAGGVDSDITFQTFAPADHVLAMGFPTATQVFIRVAEGAGPDTVAHRLTAEYAEDGLSFTSIPEEAARLAANLQALVLVFEAFLALGLFVGLAATGFLAARAVHERMRDIGTLRALGFEEGDVQRAFILESTMTALLGLLIGTASGLLVAHSIWWREVRDAGDVPFRPPVLLILGFAAAVLGLAALASRGPAKRASQLPPAIAVRHVE